MPNILFLAHRIPYPPDKGDKIRSWNILRHIAAGADVHLGAFVDDPDDMQHAAFLKTVCKSVKLIGLDKSDRLKRAWKGWRQNMPLSVALFSDPVMKQWVSSTIKANKIDRIFVFSSQMAPYALDHTSQERRIVMDFVDIDSDKFRQYAADEKGLKSWLYAREAKTLADFEKQVARHVDLSLFVSDAETAIFKKLAGSYGHSVDALHNGVDLEYFSPDAALEPVSMAGSPKLVFTGAMDYRPNIDAAQWFVSDVLPRVRQQHPGACFYIVGSKPSPDVMKLEDIDGVTVTGRVPDVRPYLAAADVSVAPVRIARGVQNKVLEAMAMGKAVVATEAAFSGIDAVPGRDLLVEDSAEAFAAAIDSLIHDPKRADACGAAARRRVVEGYSWASQLSKLDGFLGLDMAKEDAA